jgi:hypothetical protein
MKRITWKKRKPRKSIAENVAYRIECNVIRARLAVDAPTREKVGHGVINE